MTAESAIRLHEIVTDVESDSEVQVVVFKSDVPDSFLNHFDLAAVGDLEVVEQRAPDAAR